MSLRGRIIHTFLIAVGATFVVGIAEGESAVTESNVVRIITTGEAGKINHGAGVVVKMDQNIVYILTALHNVETKEPIKDEIAVEFFDPPGKSVKVNKSTLNIRKRVGADLALFDIQVTDFTPKGITPLSLDLVQLEINEDIFRAIGHPHMPGNGWLSVSGRYSTIENDRYAFDINVSPGFSGGPVIRNGKVVALIVDVIGRFGYGVPAHTLSMFLKGQHIQVAESSERASSNSTRDDDKCKLADPPITPCLFKVKK